MTATLRCPICRAEDNLGSSCRRCRADLSLLVGLERKRAWLLAEATTSLLAGQPEQSVALARQATELRGGTDSWRALALGHMLLGSFPQAWRCYVLALKHAEV